MLRNHLMHVIFLLFVHVFVLFLDEDIKRRCGCIHKLHVGQVSVSCLYAAYPEE